MATTGINTYDDLIMNTTRNLDDKIEPGFFDLEGYYFAVMKHHKYTYLLCL